MLIPEQRPSSHYLSARPPAAAEGPNEPATEQVSTLLAWRGTVRSAQLTLLQASSTMPDADDPGVMRPCRAAIMGLCQLEAKIDHYLAPKTEDAIEVLLVEEDPDLAEKYRLRLQLDGYRVRVAGDTESTLEAVTAGRPELVFLDIRLTGVKGLKVLERLRSTAAGARLPVVVLLSEHDRQLGERARELGALEWRVKNIIWP